MIFVKRITKHLLSRIWPADVVAQIAFETQVTVRHFRSWLFRRSYFRGKRHLKINVGCGMNAAPGWVNIDLEGAAGVFIWDCRRSMPFDDGSVESIFAEHVFEHLDADGATKFLRECKRCLQEGGLLRLVVPDAGRYLHLYSGDWAGFLPVRPLFEEGGYYRDRWLNRIYKTKMEFVNEVFRQGTQHKYAYDAETLILRLKEAGFSKVIEKSYRMTCGHDAPLDTAERASESLYVEAIR
jgi:predicted SAM-dependent methyltransferase